jgi:hypothetical protein
MARLTAVIMAAEQIDRRVFYIEIDPRYVDVAIRRWQRFTGRDATLESTGQRLGEMLTSAVITPDDVPSTR